MSKLTDSPIEQAFQVTIPESFENKVITRLIGEELADQKMMMRFYRLWREEARQERMELKALLAYLESQQENTPSIGSGLDEQLMEELQAMIDEYRALHEEFKEQQEQASAHAAEMEQLDNELSTALDDFFENNTSFASDGVKASKEEREQYLQLIHEHMNKHAESLVQEGAGHENHETHETLFSAFLEKLQTALNEAPELAKFGSSAVNRMQVTAKILGKEGNKHHDLHKQKFQLAVKKAACLQAMKSSLANLESKAGSAMEKIQEAHEARPMARR